MTSLIVSALQVRLLQTHRLQPQVGNRGREGLPDIRLLQLFHLCSRRLLLVEPTGSGADSALQVRDREAPRLTH